MDMVRRQIKLELLALGARVTASQIAEVETKVRLSIKSNVEFNIAQLVIGVL